MISTERGKSPLHALHPERELITRTGPFKCIYDHSVGEAEEWFVNDHCFIRGHDGLWHMFGITNVEPPHPVREIRLGHATAKNLTDSPWTKEPYPITIREDLDEIHLWAPCILLHKGLYYMYICVGSQDNTRYQISLFTSRDLRNWERHPNNPMVVDGYDARDPHVIRLDDGRWVMYYTATMRPEGGKHIVAAVTSTDLIHWGGKRLVFIDVEEGTFGGSTESPFVQRRGDWYYLFICNNDRRRRYDATDVFRSRDPFCWEFEDWVGAIDAHAMEPIQDLDGKWYATHCGWKRGGLHLAPIEWNDDLD
ncbi:MAG: family 43 glycosylhydrolase [Candidatus Sumerlaeia bacterium]|nr:family 43 glycosylhydrolase [Candidatus Sumerlaeia bacterium]